MGTTVVMVKTQIGLGVLSIPAAFDALGLIPGVLCLIAIGVTITWSNHVVGLFKRNHPEVYSIVDVGEKMGGKLGKEFMSVAFMLCKLPSNMT
jgi:amino acid permease